MTRRFRMLQNKWPIVWWTRTTDPGGGIRLPWVEPTKGICHFCGSIRCGIALNCPVSHIRRQMWRYPITVRLSEHLRSSQTLDRVFSLRAGDDQHGLSWPQFLPRAFRSIRIHTPSHRQAWKKCANPYCVPGGTKRFGHERLRRLHARGDRQ